SQRGSATLTGIYRKLLHQDHSIIVAVSGEQIVGGIVVLRASRPSLRWFILLYRPWSWWLAMYRLGLTSFSRQLVDVITLQRSTDSLQPHDYIIAVYVDEDFRGLGIGRDLVSIVNSVFGSADRRNSRRCSPWRRRKPLLVIKIRPLLHLNQLRLFKHLKTMAASGEQNHVTC
ncbi:MAG: GNAT family N-acetyltransferase, partial [Actinobacteria bacterium]|nr:GNAT family N-acetyltransferase [Actinomycetota bacterium]